MHCASTNVFQKGEMLAFMNAPTGISLAHAHAKSWMNLNPALYR